MRIQPSKISYGSGKHLGINGCAKMISLLKPRLAIITEFGEELDQMSYRVSITDVIKDFSKNIDSQILPSDVGLRLVLDSNKILCRCTNCGDYYIPLERVVPKEEKGYISYSYEAGCKTKREHLQLKEKTKNKRGRLKSAGKKP